MMFNMLDPLGKVLEALEPLGMVLDVLNSLGFFFLIYLIHWGILFDNSCLIMEIFEISFPFLKETKEIYLFLLFMTELHVV